MTEKDQNADFRRKPQIFADSPLLLEIPTFGGRRKPQKTADFRRKPKIFAENRRLGSVTLGAPPLARPNKLPQRQKQTPNRLAILSLQASRDVKSIAAGPLRLVAPVRSHSRPLPLKPNITLGATKRFRRTILWTANPGRTRRSGLVNPFAHFLKNKIGACLP